MDAGELDGHFVAELKKLTKAQLEQLVSSERQQAQSLKPPNAQSVIDGLPIGK